MELCTLAYNDLKFMLAVTVIVILYTTNLSLYTTYS